MKSDEPFDRDALASQAVEYAKRDELWNWLAENNFRRRDEHHSEFCEVLVQLHNSEQLDLIGPSNFLTFEENNQRDFWILQSLLCELIPRLIVPADTLRRCVLKLVERGGDDLAANQPNAAFREWLEVHPNETAKLLAFAQKAEEPVDQLLTFVLEAGFKQDPITYYSACLSFLKNENPHKRRSAVTALSRIEFEGTERFLTQTIEALIESIERDIDDAEFAACVGALLDVHAKDPTIGADLVLRAVHKTACRPSHDLHFALARALANHHRACAPDLQIAMIEILHGVDPSMRGIIDQLDIAYSQCLTSENRDAISSSLEAMSTRDENALDLRELDSFCHAMTSSYLDHLGWFTLTWLRHGSPAVRLQLPALTRGLRERRKELELKLEDFEFSDEELVFISRKAIGFFLIEVDLAVSILVACLRATVSEVSAKRISELLFDPLMLNYSGGARKAVESHCNVKHVTNKHLRAALKLHDDYRDRLKGMEPIPELKPSSSQQQIQAERRRKYYAEIHREAEKKSIFADLVVKQTILNGMGSIHYVRSNDGSSRRQVSMMTSHGTSMEIPKLEVIDPVYFQHMIVLFRSEVFGE